MNAERDIIDPEKESYSDLLNEARVIRAEAACCQFHRRRKEGIFTPWDGERAFQPLDDARYARQEGSLLILAHTPPTPKRFAALCGTLTRGLRAATEPPVDLNLHGSHWLPACLELLGQDPLENDSNTWRTSLSIHESHFMATTFSRSIAAFIRYAESARQVSGGVNPETNGTLVSAISTAFSDAPLVLDDADALVSFANNLIVRVSESENLRLDNRCLHPLLNACKHHRIAAEYAAMRCDDQKDRVKIEMSNLGLEFDPTYICQENDIRMRLCYQALAERYTKYINTKNIEEKRALLTFNQKHNDWLDYYCFEFGTPVESLLKMSTYPSADAENVRKNLKQLADLVLVITCSVYKDSDKSTEAQRMILEWNRLRSVFATRTVGKLMPSYREQIEFCSNLHEFFNTFAVAVGTICMNAPIKALSAGSKAGASVESATEAAEDAKKSAGLKGTSKWAGKGKIRSCIEVAENCDRIIVNGHPYKITGYEAWVRINRLLDPFSKRDKKPVPFTSEDRTHFHRGDGLTFVDTCLDRYKIGRAYATARIKPSLVPSFQIADEKSGLAAQR